MGKHSPPEVLIYLPAPLLPVRLSRAGASYRLSTALRKLGKLFIGDLDGLSARDLLGVDSRGLDLTAELVEIIQNLSARIQSLNCSSTDPPRHYYYYRKKPSTSATAPLPSRPPVEHSAFRVPQSALNIAFRIQPLALPAAAPVDLARMLTILEQKLVRLIPRDLEILKLRFGAANQAPATIFEIAKASNLSTEGVRRVLEEKVHLLREFTGPDFSTALAALSTFCQQHACVLTPSLLTQWLAVPLRAGERVKGEVHPNNPKIQSSTTPSAALRFGLTFHIRLLSEINPDLPTWPTAKTLH